MIDAIALIGFVSCGRVIMSSVILSVVIMSMVIMSRVMVTIFMSKRCKYSWRWALLKVM